MSLSQVNRDPILDQRLTMVVPRHDILSSCRTLRKPRSPCCFLNADFPERYNEVVLHTKLKPSSGFMKFATTLEPSLSSHFMSVVSQVVLYNSMQEAFLSNTLRFFGVEYLCDARNWTQHQIMSLPSSDETVALTEHFQTDTIFDAVRHALIVYSFIAILPLPLATVPFPDLAARLESGILEVLRNGQGAVSKPLLLWISSMAALAAIGTPKRASLVGIAADLCRRLDISSWESMQAVLQEYLWSDEISDFDGLYLFLEVENHMLEHDPDNDAMLGSDKS